ncbi:PREDICTED: hydroxylysine kinase-like [Amphimedon queenslandica]|uniref:Hydroxylysine kinase n=1 Tax=Amphimedon queenslandica TaxID=400682 RepID=A0A1X7V185_AMPQE|nr:PREDICTED: hydroxylysine kinase-like [Amphimedon queenslandica]|eukprot:XP_011403617.1 PREDICTED: hydroxylysine kinase-like [Amphimedon queenslandica]
MSARSPPLPFDRICNLLSQFYKFGTIDQSSIKEFDSWEDRNYYFEDKTDKYVLKIMREMPSTSVDLVRGLAEVMLYLHERRIPCSWPIKALDGKPVVVLKENELINSTRCETNNYLPPSHECRVTKEQQYCVMVLTFIEGNLADECPMTSELLFNIGSCFASMDKELQEFTHQSIVNRRYSFDLKNLSNAKPHLKSITDPQRRAVFTKIINTFESQVLPEVPYLSTGTIHNDGNMKNIIVKQGSSTAIGGVIDFCDCVHSCHIFELAVLVTMAIDSVNITPAKAIVQGYLEKLQLPKRDLNLLYYTVLGRLALVYIYGQMTLNDDTSNEYIYEAVQTAWSKSELLHSISKEDFDKALCLYI